MAECDICGEDPCVCEEESEEDMDDSYDNDEDEE